MTAHTLLSLSIFALSSVASAEPLPNHCAILPGSQGPALLDQCSRGSPTHVTGFWKPSVAQIIASEQRLPVLLAKSGHKVALRNSRRQYVGVISRGKKLIYINAFPASAFDPKEHRDWKTTAFSVCDGGDEFWGVEFDPADSTFQNAQFNGEA